MLEGTFGWAVVFVWTVGAVIMAIRGFTSRERRWDLLLAGEFLALTLCQLCDLLAGTQIIPRLFRWPFLTVPALLLPYLILNRRYLLARLKSLLNIADKRK